ncbi:MAG TPA: radical SAM protein [Paludibacteraceae bacterium]|nr:radical SAM protein [Paludibacteraceae bacterium]
MKITFLVPPTFDKNRPAERSLGYSYMTQPTMNLYELTMAAMLEMDGYSVAYEDFVITNRTHHDLERFLIMDESEIYFIWSVNLSLENDLAATKFIQKYSPESYLVYMGPAPTMYADRFLTNHQQIVVRGEPELTVRDLCRHIAQHETYRDVYGISYLNANEEIRHNPSRELIPDLDNLPFPARNYLKTPDVFYDLRLKKVPYTEMLTSRGSNCHCRHCVPGSLSFAIEIEVESVAKKTNPIFRSTENVEREIEVLAKEGYKSIRFLDDNFITTEKRLLPIAKALKKYGIVWGCQSHLNGITEHVAAILSESGCRFVEVTVESFDDEILKDIRKGLTSAEIQEAINLLNKHHVPVYLNLLFGTSHLETAHTMEDTFKKARQLKVHHVNLMIATPVPGTDFYKKAKEKGWILGGDYRPVDMLHQSLVDYPNLSNQEMQRILFWFKLKLALSPRFIYYRIRHWFR